MQKSGLPSPRFALPGRLVTSALTALLLATSCTASPDSDVLLSSDSTAEDTTTTADPSSPTSSLGTTTDLPTTVEATSAIPTPDDGEAFDEYIARRVEAFYEVRDAALEAPSPDPLTDYPLFAEFSAKEQLEVMVDAIKGYHAQNRADRETDDPAVGTSTDEEHRVSGVITNEGDLVTVFDCEVLDHDTINVTTGVVEVAGVITVLTVVTLEKIDGDWKVTHTEASQKIERVDGCYLASEGEFPY